MSGVRGWAPLLPFPAGRASPCGCGSASPWGLVVSSVGRLRLHRRPGNPAQALAAARTSKGLITREVAWGAAGQAAPRSYSPGLKASRAFWNRQAGARDRSGVPLGPGPRAAPPAGIRGPSDAQGAGGGGGWEEERAALVHYAGPVCRLRGAGESPGCPFLGWARRFPLGTITPWLQTCFPSLHSGRSGAFIFLGLRFPNLEMTTVLILEGFLSTQMDCLNVNFYGHGYDGKRYRKGDPDLHLLTSAPPMQTPGWAE